MTAKKFRVFRLRNSSLRLRNSRMLSIALHLQGEFCRLLRRANFVDIFVDNFAVFAGRTLSIFYCVFAGRSVCLSDFSLYICYLANVSSLSIDNSFLSIPLVFGYCFFFVD